MAQTNVAKKETEAEVEVDLLATIVPACVMLSLTSARLVRAARIVAETNLNLESRQEFMRGRSIVIEEADIEMSFRGRFVPIKLTPSD